jgi:hypothetical protein
VHYVTCLVLVELRVYDILAWIMKMILEPENWLLSMTCWPCFWRQTLSMLFQITFGEDFHIFVCSLDEEYACYLYN